MIDLNNAIKEFESYVNEYNMKDKMISYKFKHSYKVMEYSMSIAKSLDLTEEEINLSGLIGLLHDIGRFEQWKRYRSFRDNQSIDHGDLSVTILFGDNCIRRFIKDDIYDGIIKKSILYHNKYKIGECNEKELLFSKIVKDADKLDIFDILIFGYKNIIINSNVISDKVLETVHNKKLVDINDVKNDLDGKLYNVAQIFDIFFKYSYQIVKEKEYVNLLIDPVIKCVNKEDTKKTLLEIKNVVNNFVEDKTSKGE